MAKRIDGVSLILVICALTVTAMAVRNNIDRPVAQPPREVMPQATLSNWLSLADVDRVIGSRRAPLVIVEFSDFQCPFCRELAMRLDRVARERHDSVRVVFRHLPLTTIHAQAWTAALAAECAKEQGHFPEYQRILFDNQRVLPEAQWSTFAQEVGVSDTSAFNRCIVEQRFAKTIRRDIAIADSLGIRGTPGLVVDGKLYVGAPPLLQLRAIVGEALERVTSGRS